jgi:ABC-type phosphate/phosphonate transport system substrate-binding protein
MTMAPSFTQFTRIFATVLLLSAVLLRALPTSAAAVQSDTMPAIFRTGFLQSTFKTVDLRDAKAVLEVNSREIARIMGLGTAYEVVFFADAAAMTTAVRKGELELVALPSIEFMHMRKMASLIPVFVNSESNGLGIRYVLITRKESGIRSFSDLKGKSLLLPSPGIYEPSHLWLEVLLMREGKGKRDSFFSQVRESPKPSSAIMAVFFGQADAAIVTLKGFEVSRQLNPQIGVKLAVLVESPHLVNEVICMTTSTPESFRNNLIKAMTSFGNSKTGQQLYSIFQTSGITPFKASFIEGLENLSNEQKRLKTRTALKK